MGDIYIYIKFEVWEPQIYIFYIYIKLSLFPIIGNGTVIEYNYSKVMVVVRRAERAERREKWALKATAPSLLSVCFQNPYQEVSASTGQ